MNRFYTIITLLLSIYFSQIYAQDNQFSTAIGEWRSHLPYQNARWVTQSEDKIIFSTEWSLVTLDKEDFSFDFISKVEGLSEVGIDRIEYDNVTNQLVIAYGNSNIDIINEDEVINVPDIKQNLSLQGDKRIYDILINEGIAYFSTGFGLVQFDLNTYNFGFTTFTGLRVNDAQILGNQIFIATDDGIYSTNLNQSNIVDFNNWNLLGSDFNLPTVYSSNALSVFNGSLYAGIDDKELWKINTNSSSSEQIYQVTENGFNIQYLNSGPSNLILGTKNSTFNSRAVFFDQNDAFEINRNLCSDRTLYSIQDEQGRVWYADEWNEIRYSESNDQDCKRLRINSPFSHESSDLATKNSKLFVASGGVTESFLYNTSRLGFYTFENNDWTNWNQDSYQPIRDNELLNFFRILPHPVENKVYLGTYWAGLMEVNLEDNTTQVFDQFNSSIEGTVGDEQRERIAGLRFDRDNNLWISNFGASRPLSVYSQSEDRWQSFSTPTNTFLADIEIDQLNYKWVQVFSQTGGVFLFDDANTPFDLSDDRKKLFNSNNSELQTNSVNALAVDLDGSVWVGTTEGPVVFECGGSAFDESCTGRRIKVLQDSIAAFLLADVEIRAIAIDGANRKWFGSRNGIFVQSSDGITQELRFTTENSPLFDDNIIDLEFNTETGEMFIATNRGIQSYRTETTGARSRHSNEVFAFPNPIDPTYNGPIRIKGLARDAQVKITDINGIAVSEITALGGLATWDGKDLNGNRVASGVYLVFSTGAVSFDTPDSFVTKILFLR